MKNRDLYKYLRVFDFMHISLFKLFLTNIQMLNTVSEIQDNVDSLEEWLQEMENTLKQPLPLNSRWSKRAINEKMKELKVSLSLPRLNTFSNKVIFRNPHQLISCQTKDHKDITIGCVG